VGAVVQAEVVRGVVLGTSVTKSWREAGDPWFWQVSLTVNGAHAGAGYTLGGGPNGTDHLISARLSASRYRGVELFGGRVGLIDLDTALAGGGSALGLLGLREGPLPAIAPPPRARGRGSHPRRPGGEDRPAAHRDGRGRGAPGRAGPLRQRGKRVAAMFLSEGTRNT
jgi:hypothetical protein